MLLPLAISGGLSAVQGIADLVPGKYDKLLKKREEAIEAQKDSAGGLGLTAAERAKKDTQIMAPARAAATAGETAARRDMAATGLTTGGALAKTQQDAAAAVGKASMGAKEYLDNLDTEKAKAQEEELSSIQATRAGRKSDKVHNALDSFGQAAGVAGQLAGGPPELTKMYGLFGSKAADATAALKDIPKAATAADRSYIADVVSRSGDNLDKVLAATTRGHTTDPLYDPQLAGILARFRSLSTLQSMGLSAEAAGATPATGGLTNPAGGTVLPASTLYDNSLA